MTLTNVIIGQVVVTSSVKLHKHPQDRMQFVEVIVTKVLKSVFKEKSQSTEKTATNR